MKYLLRIELDNSNQASSEFSSSLLSILQLIDKLDPAFFSTCDSPIKSLVNEQPFISERQIHDCLERSKLRDDDGKLMNGGGSSARLRGLGIYISEISFRFNSLIGRLPNFISIEMNLDDPPELNEELFHQLKLVFTTLSELFNPSTGYLGTRKDWLRQKQNGNKLIFGSLTFVKNGLIEDLQLSGRPAGSGTIIESQ